MDYKSLTKKEIIADAIAVHKDAIADLKETNWEFMRVIWKVRDAFLPGDVTIAVRSREHLDSWIAYSPRIGEMVLVHDDGIRHSSKEHGP